MIRFSSKLLKCNLNQITIKLPQRNLSNVSKQLTTKFEPLKNIEITSLATRIHQDPLQQKLPSLNKNEVLNDNIKTILDNYNNVFGYISNYKHIYIEKSNVPIEAPTAIKSDEVIQAARLIVIRRRKMKKHKLKKLRKKMKFEWAKIRQRREMRKEKAFQAALLNQIKEAEKFSAAEYVAAKLKQANEVPIPRFWKGKRLPAFIIKEKLGIK